MVLVRTRNPLNIGAVARAMSNFGFSRLRLVQPYDLAFREARSAVGASEILAQAEVFDHVAQAIADCILVIGTTVGRSRDLEQPTRMLPQAAEVIQRRLRGGPVAVLFGSEKRGLSNEDLSYCHWLLRIPTNEQHPSMNLAQSVAVVLYDLSRQMAGVSRLPSGSNDGVASPANMQLLQQMTNVMMQALKESGYAKSGSEAAEEKLRQLMGRMQLSHDDAEVWTGMFRQILWKLRKSE